MTPEVTIRRAREEDAPAIKHVGEATWPSTYTFAGEDYIAHGLGSWWSEEAVLRGLETTLTLVAERDGVVIGMGNIDVRPERPVIWKLYVLPDQQGTGAGHALIEALVAHAPADADAVTLEYADGNHRAAEFYQRHGFEELRRDEPEQPGWPEQVWMVRALP